MLLAKYNRQKQKEDYMKALENIKILDISEKLTVSLATMYLGAYGAEVTKIEKPGTGDRARSWAPVRDGSSIYFNYLNGGKKSMALDITTPEGAEILKKMLPMYDVICVDAEAGYMESLGLGYEDLKEIREDIIYAAYSYYGQTGPYKNKVASSLTVQAKAVAMDMTGEVGAPPVHTAPSVSEHYSAAYLATGVVMALVDRNQRGIGQMIDIALYDSIFSCIEAAPAAYSTIGEIQSRKGNSDPTCAPYDTLPTADGFVALGVATCSQWMKFCAAMDYDDLAEDERFSVDATRLANYDNILKPILVERFSTLSKFDIEKRCGSEGVPCCAVLDVAEITDNPNTILNGYMTVFENGRLGKLNYPSVPFMLSKTPAKPFEDAPALGEHTDEILQMINEIN